MACSEIPFSSLLNCIAGIQTSLESYVTGEVGVVCYELMASVCYIRDKQAGGNLVAHVLAGERYHKRKEGVTHKTWYLFNDFAITPIEKVTHIHLSSNCFHDYDGLFSVLVTVIFEDS